MADPNVWGWIAEALERLSGLALPGTNDNISADVARIKYVADNAAEGGGSTPVWGGIEGVLTHQADLATVLNGKETVGTAAVLIALLDKSDVGLGNVDNTSDANKPVSTAQQAEIDTKEDVGVAAGLIAALDKSDVGLGNVDNTSDVNKPVSTATQTALDLKAPLLSPALTGVPTAPTAAAATNTTQLATTAFVQTLIANLIASAPGALDTLDELAAAFGDDPNFAATVTTALAGKQPLDADLTSIAALTTTAFGRALLELADAAALRTAAGLTANGSSLVTAASYAAMRALLDLEIGTDVQAFDADLATLAANITAAGHAFAAAADVPAQRTLLRSGAKVKRTAALTAQNWTGAGGAIAWDAEISDDGGWWDAGAPTVFTVPAGVTHVDVGCSVGVDNITATDNFTAIIQKNGSSTWDGRCGFGGVLGAGPRVTLFAADVAVSAGDTFNIRLFVSADTSVDLSLAASSFWIRAC